MQFMRLLCNMEGNDPKMCRMGMNCLHHKGKLGETLLCCIIIPLWPSGVHEVLVQV